MKVYEDVKVYSVAAQKRKACKLIKPHFTNLFRRFGQVVDHLMNGSSDVGVHTGFLAATAYFFVTFGATILYDIDE